MRRRNPEQISILKTSKMYYFSFITPSKSRSYLVTFTFKQISAWTESKAFIHIYLTSSVTFCTNCKNDVLVLSRALQSKGGKQ